MVVKAAEDCIQRSFAFFGKMQFALKGQNPVRVLSAFPERMSRPPGTLSRKEVSRWPWKGSCLRPAISRCPP